MERAGHRPLEIRGDDQGSIGDRYTAWDRQDRRLRAWLKRLPRPCGLMCASDVVALTAAREARAAGLEIPRDLAILGMDNTELQCEFGEVPLSSVDPDHEGLAAAAVRFVRERLENPALEERTRWHPPKRVVQRASTNLLALEDPRLKRALEFIHANSSRGIGVDDVVAAAGLSRRHLYRCFEERFGRSVGEEIRRMRLEEALRLIRETTLPLQSIADLCGYAYPTYLSRAVKNKTGRSPRELRKAEPDPHLTP